MITRITLLLALAAALGGCATRAPEATAQRQWNDGVWNSVLGYHGPTNAMGPVGAR